jgi:hypothetical protein
MRHHLLTLCKHTGSSKLDHDSLRWGLAGHLATVTALALSHIPGAPSLTTTPAQACRAFCSPACLLLLRGTAKTSSLEDTCQAVWQVACRLQLFCTYPQAAPQRDQVCISRQRGSVWWRLHAGLTSLVHADSPMPANRTPGCGKLWFTCSPHCPCLLSNASC